MKLGEEKKRRVVRPCICGHVFVKSTIAICCNAEGLGPIQVPASYLARIDPSCNRQAFKEKTPVGIAVVYLSEVKSLERLTHACSVPIVGKPACCIIGGNGI
jgi:hypothetical protein